MSAVLQIWSSIVASYAPYTIEFTGTLLIQLLFFWLPSAVYLSLDHVAPSFSHRHKIQPAPKQPSTRDIVDCATVAFRNQLLSIAVHITLLSTTHIFHLPPSYRIAATPPSTTEFVRDFLLCLLLREAFFYYAHRLLHTPALYARIHKQHHRFTAPIALAAQYSHPLEHFFASILPISVPPKILNSHVFTYWAFLAFELLETATVHSGYDFFEGAARMHDKHHERFGVNFGALGLLDWVHGTDGRRREKKVVE